MKTLFFILCLLPLTAFAQLGLESRCYKVTMESLPKVEELSTFTFNKTPFVKRSLNEFEMNASNYQRTVDMASTVAGDNTYQRSNVNIDELQSKFYNLSTPSSFQSDGTTRTKNTVYKEMRGLEFVNACPPFGVCARCAPYRIGRGF